MKFKRLNKRGQVETITPTEVVGLILGIALFALIILGALIFSAMYFSEKNEEFAINNFIALANMAETLSKSQSQFDTQRHFPFYMPKGYVVVGFNKFWYDDVETDGCQKEAVRKPKAKDLPKTKTGGGGGGEVCENSACLCLFENNDDFMDEDNYNVKLIQCRKIDVDYISGIYFGTTEKFHYEDDWWKYLKMRFWTKEYWKSSWSTFTTTTEILIPGYKNLGTYYGYPPQIYKNFLGNGYLFIQDYSKIVPPMEFFEYSFLYIYGQCDDYPIGQDVNLESIKLYIEKFKSEDGRMYIFIAPEGAEIIDNRYDLMRTAYHELSIEEYEAIIGGYLINPDDVDKVVPTYNQFKEKYPSEVLESETEYMISILKLQKGRCYYANLKKEEERGDEFCSSRLCYPYGIRDATNTYIGMGFCTPTTEEGDNCWIDGKCDQCLHKITCENTKPEHNCYWETTQNKCLKSTA